MTRAREMIDGRLPCACCYEYLPLTAFVQERAKPHGVGSYCRICNRKRWHDWYQNLSADQQNRIRIKRRTSAQRQYSYHAREKSKIQVLMDSLIDKHRESWILLQLLITGGTRSTAIQEYNREFGELLR